MSLFLKVAYIDCDLIRSAELDKESLEINGLFYVAGRYSIFSELRVY